jgi:hypothetical protein
MLGSGMSRDLGRKTLLTNGSFAEAVLKALSGEKGIVTPSFVYVPGLPGGEEIAKETGCEFFSVPVELGVRIWPPTYLELH